MSKRHECMLIHYNFVTVLQHVAQSPGLCTLRNHHVLNRMEDNAPNVRAVLHSVPGRRLQKSW